MSRQVSSEMWTVTANRVSDGAVVFLGSDQNWTQDLRTARIADASADAQSMLAASEADVAAARIVGPYLVAIEIADGAPRPVALRERIRVDGLTFRAIAAEAVGYL